MPVFRRAEARRRLKPAPHYMVTALAVLAIVATVAMSAVSDWRAKYFDVAAASGLTSKNIYGGLHRKDYILETTGNGVAIFDYDGDGNDDLFFANGTVLNGKPGEGGPADPFSRILPR